jgi:hypothetical protein
MPAATNVCNLQKVMRFQAFPSLFLHRSRASSHNAFLPHKSVSLNVCIDTDRSPTEKTQVQKLRAFADAAFWHAPGS